MNKQPYEMTSDEFIEFFPLFRGLPPHVKWRLYRICNKVNIEECGEGGTYAQFVEAAVEFRWDVENATVLWEDNHSYYIKEALRLGDDIPSDVLGEYSDLVEEFINKRLASKRLQEKRAVERTEEKFWKQFK